MSSGINNLAPNNPSRQLLSEMNHFTKIEQEKSAHGLCICGVEGSGDWIACDSESCAVHWYHWECVGVTEEPVGDWICPRCSAGASKVPPKARKSRRTARIVYETTEASIFENIIAESRAAAIAIKNEAKAEEVTGRQDSDEDGVETGEESTERTLVRMMSTEAHTELIDTDNQAGDYSPPDLIKAPSDMEVDEDAMILDGETEESEEDFALSIDEAASRLVLLGSEESFTVVQHGRGRDTGHKVNFFDVFPPSRVVAGMYETSAVRSTLPRLDG